MHGGTRRTILPRHPRIPRPRDAPAPRLLPLGRRMGPGCHRLRPTLRLPPLRRRFRHRPQRRDGPREVCVEISPVGEESQSEREEFAESPSGRESGDEVQRRAGPQSSLGEGGDRPQGQPPPESGQDQAHAGEGEGRGGRRRRRGVRQHQGSHRACEGRSGQESRRERRTSPRGGAPYAQEAACAQDEHLRGGSDAILMGPLMPAVGFFRRAPGCNCRSWL
mmetsp:Transcript_49381/g.148741  ORF Transcript_49381/g.148741 Transcript_49381/m.148741 type:complete len:221 (+) Transcript_49381:559-1221(+)